MNTIDNSSSMPAFITFLEERLKSELPGLEAHKLMAPLHEGNFFRSFKPIPGTKPAAVLILIYPEMSNGELTILFTLRSKELRSHKGQISFPGGRSEKKENPIETALRESEEEIGLNPENVKIIGNLSSLYVPPSKSVIQPVVAYSDNIPKTKINSDEVAEVFPVSIEKFLDRNIYKVEKWDFNGTEVEVPFWDVNPATPLWGATAMILKELLYLYDEFLSQTTMSNEQ